tara:strand:+ start:303 stop:968 length:666 start_codon:yes stop_codon:yes gene_type:complete
VSKDIQIISLVDDLQILSVADIEEAVPRTLRVVGAGGFNSAQRVLINDFGVDTFVLVSDTVLLVAPGDTFTNVPVENMNVVVISSALTGTQKARLVFGPTVRLKSVSGLQKLVQHVVKVLLTNVGSNKFRLQEGGGFLKLTAFPLTPAAQPRIVTAISEALSATETQTLAAQATQRNLDADERLLSLSMVGVSFDVERLEVVAKVRLVTFQGTSASIPLVL